jgi:hypothetical protein
MIVQLVNLRIISLGMVQIAAGCQRCTAGYNGAGEQAKTRQGGSLAKLSGVAAHGPRLCLG